MYDFGQFAISIINFLEPLYGRFGYLFVCLGSFLENTLFFGWLLPGGLVVSLGGFYIKSAGLSLPLVMIVSILGSTMGKMLDYWIGYFIGKKIVTRFNLQRQEKLAIHFINKHGARAFFLTSVVGQLRSILMITAGIIKTPFKWFSLVVFATSIIWSGVFVLLGYFLGENRKYLEEVISYIGIFGWVIIIIWIISMIWERVKPETIIKDEDFEGKDTGK